MHSSAPFFNSSPIRIYKPLFPKVPGMLKLSMVLVPDSTVWWGMAERRLEEKIPPPRPYRLVSTMATEDHSLSFCSQCSEQVQTKEARNNHVLPALCDRTEMLFSNRLCWDIWIPEELWCWGSNSILLNVKSFPFTFQELLFVSFLMQAEALVGQLLSWYFLARRRGLTALWSWRAFNHDSVEFIPKEYVGSSAAQKFTQMSPTLNSLPSLLGRALPLFSQRLGKKPNEKQVRKNPKTYRLNRKVIESSLAEKDSGW